MYTFKFTASYYFVFYILMKEGSILQKKSKIIISFVILILISISIFFVVNKNSAAEPKDKNNVNLILDGINYNDCLPKNFRKTSDLSILEYNKNINTKGLKDLNISGSQQFSAKNLPILIKEIGTSYPIIDFDLRQESHGFINGLAVSYTDSKNNANAGLTKKQVLKDEKKRLGAIKINEPVIFYNHPKDSVIATSVQDEQELCCDNSLLYYRVTVRDGGIPTDDMTDYFVDIVKNLPKKSWLHFHCKHGIGRTSTFMIMYDMMKNYKNATADEIIKRQLALANYKSSTEESFYNPERIKFLNNFYEYCKENGHSYHKSFSSWKKSKNISMTSFSRSYKNSSSYVKSSKVPKFLYVVSEDLLNKSERTMVASLQGLTSNHCSFQIYTLSSKEPDYDTWLKDLKNNHGVDYKVYNDPYELLKVYKKYIKGYVLYSRKNSMDPSINNACSYAALNEALVIDEDIEEKVKNLGIKRLSDLRNTDENWAFHNLWDKGLNHSTVIELSPDKAMALRDYAIMSKSLMFYENNKNKTALRDKIFSSMKGNSICLGWGPDEFINVSTASKCGVCLVAADFTYNLSVLSAFTIKRVNAQKLKLPTNNRGHVVTFIMSDGDNNQWNTGVNYGSNKWFGYARRNNLNLGWSMSPSLYYLSPTVFNLYDKSIKSEGSYNNFVVAPSGSGYMYPSKFKKEKLTPYIKDLNDYMGKVHEKNLTVIDDSSFKDISLWDNFTKASNINGIFYLDFKKHDNYHGEILWSNHKPIVSCRDLLWDKLESGDELINNITNRVKEGETNLNSPSAYTFVYVHVWSKTSKDVEYVVNKLKENPKIIIVAPDIFMELIKKNLAGNISPANFLYFTVENNFYYIYNLVFDT